MRLQYYKETDSLYIDLTETESVDSREVAPGVVLDFDDRGRLAGIDIDHASSVVDWSHLELESLPVKINVVDYGGALSLVPALDDPIRDARGLFKGCDLTGALLEDRRADAAREERKWGGSDPKK